MKHSEGELIWHGEYPSSVVEQVRKDIADNLDDDLEDAEDLCFHTVFLSDDPAVGPIVMVWGEQGSSALHCEYHAKAEWVSVQDLDD